jgi:hypothetical protein
LSLGRQGQKINENQNKNLQSEWLVFALKNIVLNEFLLIFFHYLITINYMKIFIEV